MIFVIFSNRALADPIRPNDQKILSVIEKFVRKYNNFDSELSVIENIGHIEKLFLSKTVVVKQDYAEKMFSPTLVDLAGWFGSDYVKKLKNMGELH